MNKPTVSQLLELLNKPNLIYWANNLGINGIKLKDYYESSSKKGISLHTQILNYVTKGIQFDDINIQNNFIKFIENKEIIDIEKKIETKYFIGRFDIKLKIKNETFICDFKSNNNIYFENLLQLTSYRMYDNISKIAIVKIPEFEFKEINIDNFKELENTIKCLHYIYNVKNNIKF